MTKVVFTVGFWDPLHRGHIAHFREAKKLGDKLVVMVHRNECCIKKKGYCFMPLEDRIAILKSIKYIDEVIVCPPDCNLTCEKVLRALKPDIFAKGGDRTPENMPACELEVCKELGIEIKYGVGGSKVQSSSWLVRDVLENLMAKKGREIIKGAELVRVSERYGVYDLSLGDLTFSLTFLNPGQSTRGHKHEKSEVYIFLRGKGIIEIDGERREVGPGDFLFIKPNQFHRVHNPNEKEMVFACVFSGKREV